MNTEYNHEHENGELYAAELDNVAKILTEAMDIPVGRLGVAEAINMVCPKKSSPPTEVQKKRRLIDVMDEIHAGQIARGFKGITAKQFQQMEVEKEAENDERDKEFEMARGNSKESNIITLVESMQTFVLALQSGKFDIPTMEELQFAGLLHRAIAFGSRLTQCKS